MSCPIAFDVKPEPEQKIAMIFGVTGQDGSYLSEFLLDKGYKVIGVCRRSSIDNTGRLVEVKKHNNFELVEGDITDSISVSGLIGEYHPHECYNLAAQSHVGTSFKQPSYTFQVGAVGTLNILEAVRVSSPETRVYHASTSEMFGNNRHEVIANVGADGNGGVQYYQDESLAFEPTSPYAVAKTAAHHLMATYRKAYDIHASCGILFNHESPRRGDLFVTRKITKWIGEFARWKERKNPDDLYFKDYFICEPEIVGQYQFDKFPKLRLGNLDAARDWGHAKDYIQAMWMMLQKDEPDDYVIATGVAFTVRDFLRVAFKHIGIDDWENYVVIDPKFYRPSEVHYLCGNSNKARTMLGWRPKITFDELVTEMVEYDIQEAKKKVE